MISGFSEEVDQGLRVSYWRGTGESIFQNACGLYGTVDSYKDYGWVGGCSHYGVASRKSNKPTCASK